MNNARTFVLVLGITAIMSTLPRAAAADTGIDGRQVLTWALIGGVVGGVVGLVAALSKPKAPAAVPAPAGPAAWTALDLLTIPHRQPTSTATDTSGLGGALFTF